jgi:hypothetical protein
MTISFWQDLEATADELRDSVRAHPAQVALNAFASTGKR